MAQLREQRESAIEQGRKSATESQPYEALKYYHIALTAQRELFARSSLQTDKFQLLAEERFLYAEAAYLHALIGEAHHAALILETGRAQILGEAWVRDYLFPAKLEELDPQLAARFRQAAAVLAELENRERDIWHGPRTEEERTAALDELRVEVDRARRSLEGIITEAGRVVDYPTFCAVQAREHVEALAGSGTALVYIATTYFGSFAIIVTGAATAAEEEEEGVSSYKVCWMDDFTQRDVINPVSVMTEDADIIIWTVGSTLRGANSLSQQEGSTERWYEVLAQLESVLSDVGRKLLAPLTDFLLAEGIRDLTLIPCADLAQVPLQIAPFTLRGKTGCMVDHFDLRFVPSARYGEISLRAAEAIGDQHGVCTVIQSPDMQGAKYELEHLESLWPGVEFRRLTGKGIDRDDVKAKLRGASHVVLSCHGFFQYWDQLGSGFKVGQRPGLRTILDLRDMLNEKLLDGCRMVVASACQSAFEDSPTTLDECIGLSFGLLCTGAAGVLGTLWNVHDIVSAIVVTRFHQDYFTARASGQSVKPWAILSAIQRWLKSVSYDELQEYIRSTPTLAALVEDYQEDFGDAALSQFFATHKELSAGAKRLIQLFPATENASRGARMPAWFWGAFIYAGA
ncbi:MAG TPA: CHAT domain-containing protein [Pyrinomonadaceae bacterium]|nr:CHAT domain-containing protein [Pyrinomonadaceae bacterium]